MKVLLAQAGGFAGALMLVTGAMSLANKLFGSRLGIKYLGAAPADYVTAAVLLGAGAALVGVAVAVSAQTSKPEN